MVYVLNNCTPIHTEVCLYSYCLTQQIWPDITIHIRLVIVPFLSHSVIQGNHQETSVSKADIQYPPVTYVYTVNITRASKITQPHAELSKNQVRAGSKGHRLPRDPISVS